MGRLEIHGKGVMDQAMRSLHELESDEFLDVSGEDIQVRGRNVFFDGHFGVVDHGGGRNQIGAKPGARTVSRFDDQGGDAVDCPLGGLEAEGHISAAANDSVKAQSKCACHTTDSRSVGLQGERRASNLPRIIRSDSRGITAWCDGATGESHRPRARRETHLIGIHCGGHGETAYSQPRRHAETGIGPVFFPILRCRKRRR